MASEISLSTLAKLIAESKTELSNEIQNFRKEMDSKFNSIAGEMKAEIDTVCRRQKSVESRLDELERKSLLNDLLINGIPLTPNENMREIFVKICHKLGFAAKEYTILAIFRLKTKSTQPTIVVKFISKDARNEFFQLYLKQKNLSLLDVGFLTEKRIFIHESLTKKNVAIFKDAMVLKKETKLHTAFTHDGIVHVRSTPEGISQQILDIEQLLEFRQTKRKLHVLNTSSEGCSPEKSEAKLLKVNENSGAKSSAATSVKNSTPKAALVRQSSLGTLNNYFSKSKQQLYGDTE